MMDDWFKKSLQVSALIFALSFNVVVVVSIANYIQCVL